MICTSRSTTLQPRTAISVVAAAFSITASLPGSTPVRSEIQHQTLRILQRLLDANEEGHGFLAVHDAVVIAERQIHHGTDDDLPADHDRPLLDLVHAKNAGLRSVQDRRRHERAVDAAVGYCERAALHVGNRQLAVA